MEELLTLIGQFGVIPLLIIAVIYLWKKVSKLETQVEEKNDEIRSVEKENTSLLYKCLSAIKKLKGNE